MSDDARTGGQYCVTGLVLQMLVGLDRGLRLVIGDGRQEGSRLVSVTMVLEPDQGGDHDVTTPGGRLVEQVKIRTTGEAWTPGDIAGDVLPDLAKAVRLDDDTPTRFRLVTDGGLNCGTLLDLAGRIKGRPRPQDVIGALDDGDRRAFYYGRWLSERGFFEALLKRARVDDPQRFWRLLAGFEAEGNLTEAELARRIDAILSQVVDHAEDITGKRHELLSRMATLAQNGGSTTAATLLGDAGLPVQRLLHRARLPGLLAERLTRDLEGLGYDAAADVREPPRASGGGLLTFAGNSGLGKSWRLAALLGAERSAGRLAILIAQAADLDQVRRAIIERVWLSGFDQPVDLPTLQRRLGTGAVDADGIWLTVGIDDIQDRAMLARLYAADWEAYGIRVAVTAPTQLADEPSARPRPPAVQQVQPFTRAQLRRFLEHHGQDARDLPDDVAELLCTPIFAELYRRRFEPGWRPNNEYELIDGFWRHATYDQRGMADAQDDVAALEEATRRLLVPAAHYPWEAQDALEAGLGAPARVRLVATGVLRAGPDGVGLSHDRLLNWAAARALVADLKRNRRTAAEVVELIGRFRTPGTIAAVLTYRMNYVLLDLLWIGTASLDASILQEIVAGILDAPDYRINEGPFIEEDLAGLGPGILLTLERMAMTPDTEHRPRAIHAARAIATIGQRAPTVARPVVARLLESDAHGVRMGLAAAAKLDVPHAIERLWTLHLERRQASAAATDDLDVHDRHDLYDRAQSSGKAFERTARTCPDWLKTKLDGTGDALSAQVLLELLLLVEHSVAVDIWRRRKVDFLTRIPAGRTVLARAIGRFGDRDEADRLEAESDGAEWLEPTRRFDALLRVAPERAAEQIASLPEETLRRGWFSLEWLVRRGGEAAQQRLLQRHGTDWEGVSELVHSYWHDADLIDRASFQAVINGFEARLAAIADGATPDRREGQVVEFLSRTRRSDLLEALRACKGGALERSLIALARDRESRASLSVDQTGDHLEHLLLRIGGEGYGAFVADAIERDTVFAREDGYEAALRLPEGAPAAEGLGTAVGRTERHDRETYDLMLALAVQRFDGPLYELVAATASAYNDALDIRASLGPLDPAVETRIRADLQSPESAVRIGATCALAMAPPPDAAELLADTLSRCPDDDPSALTVVRLASHLSCYAPTMLPQLRRMLDLPDPKAREAVLPYLAEHGDSEARAEVVARFATEPSPVADQTTLRAAYALSVHESTDGPGLSRLKLFIDRRHSIYPTGLLAARLHERGAMTNDELVELAYTAQRLPGDSAANIIDRVVTFDRKEALALARYHSARSGFASGARQLLILGGHQTISELLTRYISEERHRARWIIARALRRHANRATLLEQLSLYARGNSTNIKIAAAELLGWLRDDAARATLATLLDDSVPEVADAALAAEARQRRDDHARQLIGELGEADHLGRWARLEAIIALADPYLLELDPDGLAIGEVINPFGEAMAIGTEKLIKARKDKLEKESDQLDRNARN